MTLFVVLVCSEKGQVKQMSTIQDLYYGRISPYEMSISTAPEYQKLKALADKNEDLLRESLSNEEKELLDKLTADDRRNERRLTAPVAPCKPM